MRKRSVLSWFAEPMRRFGQPWGALLVLAPVLVSVSNLGDGAHAKTPGAIHCYKGVCHRVKSIPETEALIGETLRLRASHYGHCRNDRFNPCALTSSGEPFRAHEADNAASPELPDGTVLLLYYPSTGHAAVVRINNAGPYWGNRRLDVSRATARALGFERKGVAELEARVLKAPEADEAHYRRRRRYPAVLGPIGRHASIEAARKAVGGVIDPRQHRRLAGEILRRGLAPQGLEASKPDTRRLSRSVEVVPLLAPVTPQWHAARQKLAQSGGEVHRVRRPMTFAATKGSQSGRTSQDLAPGPLPEHEWREVASVLPDIQPESEVGEIVLAALPRPQGLPRLIRDGGATASAIPPWVLRATAPELRPAAPRNSRTILARTYDPPLYQRIASLAVEARALARGSVSGSPSRAAAAGARRAEAQARALQRRSVTALRQSLTQVGRFLTRAARFAAAQARASVSVSAGRAVPEFGPRPPVHPAAWHWPG